MLVPVAFGLWHSGHGGQVNTRDSRCALNADRAMWFDGCDTCMCARGQKLCTKRSCSGPYTRRRRRHLFADEDDNDNDNFDDVYDNDESVIGVLRRQSFCRLGMKPGDDYKIECNICICNEEGIEMCSMKTCPSAPIWAEARSTRSRRAMRRKRSRESYDRMNHGICADKLPGDVISDGCHQCKCSYHGLVCSRNYCPTYGVWS